MPAFAFLVWQGWKHRPEAQWHKRLMLGAAMVIVLGPLFGGFPGSAVESRLRDTNDRNSAVLRALFICRHTIGKTHPATKIAFGVYALCMLIRWR